MEILWQALVWAMAVMGAIVAFAAIIAMIARQEMFDEWDAMKKRKSWKDVDNVEDR